MAQKSWKLLSDYSEIINKFSTVQQPTTDKLFSI